MLLGKQCYLMSTKYFDMAVKYVPANDKKLLVDVLCNRSDARQGSDDFEGALEDAKNVTKFSPDLLKVCMTLLVYLFVCFCICVFFILKPCQRILHQGYENLLQCYKKLGRHAEAIQAINECLERSPLDDRYHLLKDALSISCASSGTKLRVTVHASLDDCV